MTDRPRSRVVTPRPDTGSLAALLAKATPGPWRTGKSWLTITREKRQAIESESGHELWWSSPENARLIALCPDAVALLCGDRPVIEWAASIACLEPNEEGVSVCEGTCVTCVARELLARFAELEERAR